jgi:hypothetical protein
MGLSHHLAWFGLRHWMIRVVFVFFQTKQLFKPCVITVTPNRFEQLIWQYFGHGMNTFLHFFCFSGGCCTGTALK